MEPSPSRERGRLWPIGLNPCRVCLGRSDGGVGRPSPCPPRRRMVADSRTAPGRASLGDCGRLTDSMSLTFPARANAQREWPVLHPSSAPRGPEPWAGPWAGHRAAWRCRQRPRPRRRGRGGRLGRAGWLPGFAAAPHRDARTPGEPDADRGSEDLLVVLPQLALRADVPVERHRPDAELPAQRGHRRVAVRHGRRDHAAEPAPAQARRVPAPERAGGSATGKSGASNAPCS